jgi:hypothetical protein
MRPALEAVGAEHKVGDRAGVAIGRVAAAFAARAHARRDQRRLGIEPAAGLRHGSRRIVEYVDHHRHLHRGDRAPRRGAQPRGIEGQHGAQVGLARAQAGLRRQRLHDRVAREFAVPLPLQRAARQREAQEIALQVFRPQRLLAGQAAQVFALGLPRHAFVEQRQIRHQRRQRHLGRRPRMHLVVKLAALRVVGRQQVGHFIDRCHTAMVAGAPARPRAAK